MQFCPPVKEVTWHPSACHRHNIDDLSQLTINEVPPVTCQHDPKLPAQGYHLRITDDEICLNYGDQLGRWYGVQSLRQWQQFGQGQCVEVRDWPDYPVRGVLLDISRDRVPTMAKLTELIEMWRDLKINQLQLYMEAAFAYQGEEAAWQGRSPITAAELDQIHDLCQKNGIELVANQATFGHMENWLDLPEYQHLAENIGGCYDGAGNFRNHSFCLSATNPQAKRFVARLFDELLDHFDSPWVNVNCDETFDLGVGDSRQACQQHGKGEVYLDYVLAIYDMLTQRGKRMMHWADILLHYPHLIERLPKNVVALNWGYEAGHDWQGSCQALSAAGIEHYVVAGTSTFAALTGRWQNCRHNIEEAAKAGRRYGAAGFYISEWGDFGHAQPWVAGYPGQLLGAAKAWSIDQSVDVATQLARFMPSDCIEPMLRLGDAYLLTQTSDQLPGVGIFGALLFNQMTNRHMKKIQHWSPAGFRQAGEVCRQAIVQLQQGQASYARSECLVAAELALLACEIGEALGEQQDYRIERLANPEQWAERLAQCITAYQQVWRNESREGGLSDSVDRLQYLLGKLQGA